LAPTLSCSNINQNILKEQVTMINLASYTAQTNGWPVTYALNAGFYFIKKKEIHMQKLQHHYQVQH
jgi:hypothetical protein